MGNKRNRNHYPRLPDAVLNLLALHSLEAWPAKYRTSPRGAKSWAWRVTKVGDDHITSRALWAVQGSRDLDFWMQQVDIWKGGKSAFLSLDFETYSGTKTGRWCGLKWNASSVSLVEPSDIEARVDDAMAKFR